MLGVPVVAARQGGGVLDIVPPDGPGRLTDATDPQQMAQAIKEVLEDGNSRRQASEKGEILKKQLNSDAVAAVFEDLYSRAVSGE